MGRDSFSREKVNDEFNDFDEFGDVQAGELVDGLPSWENRELSSEYVHAEHKATGIDKPFLILTLVILLIGVVMVLSASFARAYYTSGEPMKLFTRQLVFAISGVALMLLTSQISIRVMSRW